MGRLSRVVDRAVNGTALPGRLSATQRAQAIVRDSPVVDLLVGTPIFRTPDFDAWRAAGLNIVGLTVATTWPDLRGTWSRWHFRSLGLPPSATGSPLAIALWQLGRIRAWCSEVGDSVRMIRRRSDLDACLVPDGPLGVLVGVQGGHVLEGDTRNVGRLYEMGVGMLAPAHTMDNPLVGSSTGRRRGGLTGLGREVVAECEARGAIVDLAHMSLVGIEDALASLTRPFVVSHTGVREAAGGASRWRRFSPATRNLPAAVLEEVARRGGLVGLVLASQLVGGASLGHVVATVQRAVLACGAQGVALGSDIDGALKMVIDHHGLPALVDALLDAGLDERVVRAYLGVNAIRFLGAALPA